MTSTLHPIKSILFWVALVSLPIAGQTQAGSIFDLLYGLGSDENAPELELQLDLTALLNDSLNADVYLPAQLLTTSANNTVQTWELGVKKRGRFRQRVCDFPPLKLNFDKSALKAQGMSGFDKLKLVTHCLDDRIEGQENLLKEYLAYQLYNTLTPESFRVKLVRIKYVDTGGTYASTRRYALLLESEEELAERLGWEECKECYNTPHAALDTLIENRVALYQYAIGNTDWSIKMLRNVALYRMPSQKIAAVPYDFDFSGLVNPSYGIPSGHLGQRQLTDRIFMGMSVQDAVFRYNIGLMVARKEAMLNAINSTRLLSLEARFTMKNYLNLFFAELSAVQRDPHSPVMPAFRQAPLLEDPASSRPAVESRRK